MKKMRIFAAGVLAAVAASAASSVGNVQVSQNLPWDGRAAITFTVAGDPCHVGFTATWRGQFLPVPLAKPALSGMPDGACRPGTYCVMWDPATAGYGSGEKADFRVRAYVVSTTGMDKNYLVFDLATGASEFMDAPPPGGWTDEYKSRYMPFRRVPAGTYTNGIDTAWHNLPIPNGVGSMTLGSQNRPTRPAEVIISSPYYVSVFPVTRGNFNYIEDVWDSNEKIRAAKSYAALRGHPATDGVNWPETGFNVAEGSYIRKMRDRMAAGTPPGWFLDLPTSAQWEIAMRAGTTTIFPNGGDDSTTPQGFTNLVNEIYNWAGHNKNSTTVGRNSPNAWGIYDLGGAGESVMIDGADYTVYNGDISHRTGTDPKGRPVTTTTANVVCRGGGMNSEIFVLVPSWWYSTTVTSAMGFRLVINTTDWTK